MEIAESTRPASHLFASNRISIMPSPMLDALQDFLAFPALLLDLAADAMGFSTAVFQRAAASAEIQTAALFIAFLAGISEMLGQSVILVINRIVLYRFLASLLFTGFTYVLTALAWAVSAIAIAPLTRIGNIPLDEASSVVGIVALAFAPRLLGVISIAPYFGLAFGNLLESWAMILVIFGLHVALGLPLGAAVFCGVAGWALSYWVRIFLGHMLAKPLSHLRKAVAGSALDKTPQQIIDDLIKSIQGETQS